MPISLTTELIGTTASVVVPVVGLAVAYMRLSVSRAVATLKLDLIRDLNGTYTRRGECVLAHTDIKERLERVDGDIEKLDRHIENQLIQIKSQMSNHRHYPMTPREDTL